MTRPLPVIAAALAALLCLVASEVSSTAAVTVSISDVDSQSGARDESVDPLVDDLQPENMLAGPVDCNYQPADRWWFQADYSVMWIQGNPLPPLVTTSPQGTDRDDAGVLGLPGTQILFGNEAVDKDGRQGGRLRFGLWLDGEQTTGIECSFMALGGADTRYRAASTGDPILARPYFDAADGAMASLLTAFPEVIEGLMDINTDSEMYTAGVLLRRNWRCGSRGRIDVLGGYRYLRFREGLSVTEELVSTDPMGLIQVDTEIDVRDSFDAATDFHGGEVGLAAEFFHDWLSLRVLTKLGIGGVRQVVAVDGSTVVTTPGDPPVSFGGGVLARPSNMGTRVDNRFALLPELGATLNFQLTKCWTLSCGYSCLYLTEVARTGDQIDLGYNSPASANGNTLPGSRQHPESSIESDGMWVQGLNVGGVLKF